RARGTGSRRTGRGAGAFRCMLTSREAHLQTETVLSWVGYADARDPSSWSAYAGGCGDATNDVPSDPAAVPVRSRGGPARSRGAWGAAALAGVADGDREDHCLCPPGPAAPWAVPHPGAPR